VSAPAQSLVDPETWCFRPREELASELGGLLDSDRRSDDRLLRWGISATVDIFVLSMLGRDDVLLYDGSLPSGAPILSFRSRLDEPVAKGARVRL